MVVVLRKNMALVISAFPNIYPYNDLLLAGKLDTEDGKYGLKTRMYAVKPGWRVLYTSKSRVEHAVANLHGLDWKKAPRGVLVGIGFIEFSRLLTGRENIRLVAQFNGSIPLEVSREEEAMARMVAVPLPFGCFFRKDSLYAFKQPVPYDAIPGPTRSFPVPMRTISRALREVGVDPATLK